MAIEEIKPYKIRRGVALTDTDREMLSALETISLQLDWIMNRNDGAIDQLYADRESEAGR